MKRLAGIWFTQVGDPLSHVGYCLSHGASPDRDTGTTRSSVVVAVDEQEAELGGLVRDITEGWIDTELGAEGGPVAKGVGLGATGFRGVGSRGDLERRAESKLEVTSGGSVTNFQGRGCG